MFSCLALNMDSGKALKIFLPTWEWELLLPTVQILRILLNFHLF